MDHDKNKKHIVCPVDICEDIAISVPVELNARAEVGEIKLECGGHHIEKEMEKHNRREFTIVQKIHVRIPIKFFAECEVKEEHVEFNPEK